MELRKPLPEKELRRAHNPFRQPFWKEPEEVKVDDGVDQEEEAHGADHPQSGLPAGSLELLL